jgi:hypothetical protein
MIDKTKFTHDAYILKTEGMRKGRRLGYWIPEGVARVEPDGSLFVYLHSLPVGGWDGRIRCRKFGEKPPEIKQTPQRPGEDSSDDDGEDDGEA